MERGNGLHESPCDIEPGLRQDRPPDGQRRSSLEGRVDFEPRGRSAKAGQRGRYAKRIRLECSNHCFRVGRAKRTTPFVVPVYQSLPLRVTSTHTTSTMTATTGPFVSRVVPS